MNLGVERQKLEAKERARARGEKQPIDDGPLASDKIVRYSCQEKYDLGSCNAGETETPPPAPRKTQFPPGTIETFTGDVYNFSDPLPSSIHLEDIAHALSNHCRYAGHTKRFYSVGEHSILVSRILKAQGWDERIQILGLFHDGHEAYVMDAPRPLKPFLGQAFKGLAERADWAIAAALSEWAGQHFYPQAFELTPIKKADEMALVFERKQLMTAGPDEWEPGYENVPDLPDALRGITLGATSPTSVKLGFLAHANNLGVAEK